MSVYVLNAQTRSPDRPSLKYSSGGSGPLIKKDEAFCLATSNGGGQYIICDISACSAELAVLRKD